MELTWDDILMKVEQLQYTLPVYATYSKGSDEIVLDSFGWKEYYTPELRRYLRQGVASFKIYDK